jgi:hypothetical protein
MLIFLPSKKGQRDREKLSKNELQVGAQMPNYFGSLNASSNPKVRQGLGESDVCASSRQPSKV